MARKIKLPKYNDTLIQIDTFWGLERIVQKIRFLKIFVNTRVRIMGE